MNLKLCRASLFLLLLIFSSFLVRAGETDNIANITRQRLWVDSVFKSLTPDQRLGQLFMVAAFSNKDQAHVAEIEKLVRDYYIGGLMFMRGGPVRQARLTNQYQALAKVPLLIALDAEWGLQMRLDSSMQFPKQMTLGAIHDAKYTYVMGHEIALKLKRLGVHVSFSPVVDVNSNPKNPVIGMRSFGESKEAVSANGIAYMKGLQDQGILAVAKHFPGHGDTDTDSHYTLPVVNFDYKRLSEVELYPFKKAFDAGIMGVMVAHLQMPVFDTTTNRASTLSPAIVTGLLQEKMGYKGLIFTDALNMKGVSSFYKPGEVDVLALLAGNDVLLFPENVPQAIAKIKEAITAGLITQEEIDRRVQKVLFSKYWAGLNQYQPINLTNLQEELDRPYSFALNQQLYEKAITIVNNKQNLLPINLVDTTHFASLSIGSPLGNAFQNSLDNYATFSHFSIADKYDADSVFAQMTDQLKSFGTVVIGIHSLINAPQRDFGIYPSVRTLVEKLQNYTNIIVVVFGNPYSLRLFEKSNNLVCAYEDNSLTQAAVPQALFGALPVQGKLPVTTSPFFKIGTGVETTANGRMRYATPESVGLSSAKLNQIDNIAMEAIAYAATPGCQVLVAKDGAIVFNRSYGSLTYSKSQPVTNNTLYDIASVTKVAGTLQAIMYLKDQGRILLDEKISTYLPELRGTNKENLIIREILAHQAGLVPFIPHWKKTMSAGKPSPVYYDTVQSAAFPVVVRPGMYAIASIEDSVWKWTVKSELLPKNATGEYDYKYSDLGFYIMKRLAEKLLKQPVDEFMEQNFYTPMGLTHLLYKPLRKFPESCIAPTEIDQYFRNDTICGTVHDQGAAMLGGVAGHAGLFANAHDLALLMQMNLQNGYYGGHHYFKKKVVTEFSKKQFKNSRRALGWDKPEPKGGGPTSALASSLTFGHTGFTGTCVWIDPASKLIYIFLSNRTYPSADNNKLVQYNIRTRIHDIIYSSILPK